MDNVGGFRRGGALGETENGRSILRRGGFKSRKYKFLQLLTFGMAFWVDSGVTGMKGTTLSAPFFQVTTGDKQETSWPRTPFTKSVLREDTGVVIGDTGEQAGEAGGSVCAGRGIWGAGYGLGGADDRGDSGAYRTGGAFRVRRGRGTSEY